MTKRALAVVASLALMGGALASTALSASSTLDGALEVDVQVSPSTIVLGLDKGASVTVHTDIALGYVDRAAGVFLDGVPAYATFADSCGNLVAKFSQEEIEAIVAPPQATLMLTGTTTDGTPFSGSDTVRVIDDPSPED